jgi:hypothetical protein
MNMNFHITLQNPPPGFDFGLQKGSGSKHEAVQIQRSAGNGLYFTFTAEVKGVQGNGQEPDFKIPFVQGRWRPVYLYRHWSHGRSTGRDAAPAKNPLEKYYTGDDTAGTSGRQDFANNSPRSGKGRHAELCYS